MANNSRKTVIIAAGAMTVIVLIAFLWRCEMRSPHKASADAPEPRDLIEPRDSQPVQQAATRSFPLGLIPWKRDSDSFACALVPAARLPWLRRTDQPTAVMLWTADLPWNQQRLTSNTRLFLETGKLPWRY